MKRKSVWYLGIAVCMLIAVGTAVRDVGGATMPREFSQSQLAAVKGAADPDLTKGEYWRVVKDPAATQCDTVTAPKLGAALAGYKCDPREGEGRCSGCDPKPRTWGVITKCQGSVDGGCFGDWHDTTAAYCTKADLTVTTTCGTVTYKNQLECSDFFTDGVTPELLCDRIACKYVRSS